MDEEYTAIRAGEEMFPVPSRARSSLLVRGAHVKRKEHAKHSKQNLHPADKKQTPA